VTEHGRYIKGKRVSNQLKKQTMGMAGEYYVTAELNRQGIHASMTYGNAKKADIVAYSPEQKNCEVIEVKTTDKNKWVVGGKMPTKNDNIWVLVLLSGNKHPRYFIFTGEELHKCLEPQDLEYRKKYLEKHGKEFDSKGVVSLKQELAIPFENKWSKITDRFNT